MLVPLETTDFVLFQQVTTGAGVPIAADSNAVTYAIYPAQGATPGTALLNGSFGTTIVDSKTGWYKTASLSITAANGFESGGVYRVRTEVPRNLPLALYNPELVLELLRASAAHELLLRFG